MPDIVDVWIEKAKQDERVSRLIEAAGEPLTLAAYHLQQAAEKRIKARLVRAGVKPKKTHDLVALATDLSVDLPDTILECLTSLSILAWTTRYPGFEIKDETDYREILSDYQNLVVWLEGLA